MACRSAGRTGWTETGEKGDQEADTACWWHYGGRFVYGLLCSLGEWGDCCRQECWDTEGGKGYRGWENNVSSCWVWYKCCGNESWQLSEWYGR